MAVPGAALWRNLQVYQVFGANTNVGKTIFSTILCRVATRRSDAERVWYLKPVSTGAFDDADKWHLDRFARGITTQNFYQFDEPVSPHLAAKTVIPDHTLVTKIVDQIKENAQHGSGFMLVESAGGPHSPGPSGTSQADIYRPLRLPTIFIADWQLGGISTSISSYEALRLRGYDIDGAAIFEDSTYRNYEYLRSYFQDRDIPLLTVPRPPEYSQLHDHAAMSNYYVNTESGTVSDGSLSAIEFADRLAVKHESRISRLHGMASSASKHIWYPFTQHKLLTSDTITTIDSAHGDYFQTYRAASQGNENSLVPSVDASASWWTQGLGHSNVDLAMSAAYAAGRYGHVMFASAVNEPALKLAETLVQTLENPRIKRVFYSDDGSTAVEVAIKMGLQASCVRYGWDASAGDVGIIGLKNSYHGDTIGAMDASEPSIYNAKVPWYSGRGFWFDTPSVSMKKGVWTVDMPEGLQGELSAPTEFTSLRRVFDRARDTTDVALLYEKYIRDTLTRLTLDEKRKFGALVMEPVVLGAGGMLLVDPLFQRILVNVIRDSQDLFAPNVPQLTEDIEDTTWTGLPIIADEVFTGLYRLGHKTACSLLHIHPDISVNAKLLTGGLVPLSVTLASESIFDAFLSDSKADCLLHGHSYTAHPVGCAVANTSLQLLTNLDEQGKWDAFKDDWIPSRSATLAGSLTNQARNVAHAVVGAAPPAPPTPPLWSVWSKAFVSALSHASAKIDSTWALGSVLCIALRDEQGGGYGSNVAKDLQQKLLQTGPAEWNIHSRVLGNVLYLMTSQVTTERDVRLWEARVTDALGI